MVTTTKQTWQISLQQAVTTIDELAQLLELDAAKIAVSAKVDKQFPLRIPRGFVARMRRGDADDPLLLQVLPQNQELTQAAGYSLYPLQEQNFNPLPGALHKYQGRVLLIAAGACAVNCRYCFRRHFPYDQNALIHSDYQAALAYIKADQSIEEVILSGGDPLMLKDETISPLIQAIANIPQIQRLRVHSRLPVVLPERMTPSLIEMLSNTRLQTVLVIHANHANELDASVEAGLRLAARAGIMLLNQSVLLKGVNDQVETLAQLSRRLFTIGVLPYYLHLLDRVQGSAHFFVDSIRAQQLMIDLRAQLSGYLVPKLVKEIPGEKNKTQMG